MTLTKPGDTYDDQTKTQVTRMMTIRCVDKGCWEV